MALAAYSADALQRLLDLRERVTVAEALQRAMPTTLPGVPGVELATQCRPAHAGEQVGDPQQPHRRR